MSTNTLIKVEGAAWTVQKEVQDSIRRLTTSEGITHKLGLDYTVSTHHLKTDIDEPVPDFWAIYRDDSEKYLGAVKSSNPQLIQNADSFRVLEPMIKDGILKPCVVDTYREGAQIFGCFEFTDPFNVAEDAFKQYFIVVNNHLKPNGQLDIISTPVRIACMNAMNAALSKSTMKFTIPGIVDDSMLPDITKTILNAHQRTSENMVSAANKLINTPIDNEALSLIIDEIFPYVDLNNEATNHSRANQTVDVQREAFMVCYNEENIKRFRNTAYGVFNALTDYSQHYFNKAEKGFDLKRRMEIIPGFNPESTNDSLRVAKFMKNLNRYAKAA